MIPSARLFYLVLLLYLASCVHSFEEPNIDLSTYHLEEGFVLECIASEPLIESPVDIDFDLEGRLWVVEMNGYMPNIEGLEEELPTGRISILEDKDQDGIMDHKTVFLDSLILPRALKLAYGGLLYAEPPNLWFVSNIHGSPGEKELVDSTYAVGGNVEHQPNGLLLHLDNWIYSAKSSARYRRKNNQWLKEVTSFRGQWGITSDNSGRLYYNNNSVQLQGDLVLPNLLMDNPFVHHHESIGHNMVDDQRVFPLHATSVNRGYQPNVLDKTGKLKNFTSACGPLIYRDRNWGPEYYLNGYVCAPEANLVKRNLLYFDPDSLKIGGAQAYEESEFLASTEETFRPVNLKTGPDGAMYVVDMHKGIIQHRTYMTSYLSKQLKIKGLDTIHGMGRILRVVKSSFKNHVIPDLSQLSDRELVLHMSNKLSWIRDRAQQEIIHRSNFGVLDQLKQVVLDTGLHQGRLHALYALEGLESLDENLLSRFVQTSPPNLTVHGIHLFGSYLERKNYSDAFIELIPELLENNSYSIDFYLASVVGRSQYYGSEFLERLLLDILQRHRGDDLIHEALVNSLNEKEKSFLALLSVQNTTYGKLQNSLIAADKNRNEHAISRIHRTFDIGEGGLTNGLVKYRDYCMLCHGPDGEGIDQLAPSLRNSKFIDREPEYLGLIVLYGMDGPIVQNGETFTFNTPMPGLIENPNLTNRDIADIIHYIRNAFGNPTDPISDKTVDSLRHILPTGQLLSHRVLEQIQISR